MDNAAAMRAVMQRQRAAGVKNAATIFAPLEDIAKWAGAPVNDSIDLEGIWPEQIAPIISVISLIEETVKSSRDIASLSLSIGTLPLGHHAYRIPVLLKMLDMSDEFDAYTKRVGETKFIADYGDFLTELSSSDPK